MTAEDLEENSGLEIDLSFPKVELHCHLDGCFRIPTIIDLAKKRHVALPSYDVDELTKLIKIDKPMGSLENYLSRFKIFAPTFSGDRESIARITREALEDKKAHNISYIELRFSPQLLANHDVDPVVYSHTKGHCTPRDVIETVSETARKCEDELGIKSRLILCTIVGFESWAMETAKLVEEYRSKGVVGIDIAGIERGDFSKSSMEAFEYVKNIGLHRTAHAGEAGDAEKVEEAIDDLFTERIGHGYHVVADNRIYKKAKESNVHFEVCPLSSRYTSSVSTDWKKHPAIRFHKDGVNFSLNTDDPGVQCSTIVDDYHVAVNEWGFTEDTLKELNLNAARSCFLETDEKKELIYNLKNSYYPG